MALFPVRTPRVLLSQHAHPLARLGRRQEITTTASRPGSAPPSDTPPSRPTDDDIEAVIQMATANSLLSPAGSLRDTRTQLFVGNVSPLCFFHIHFHLLPPMPAICITTFRAFWLASSRLPDSQLRSSSVRAAHSFTSLFASHVYGNVTREAQFGFGRPLRLSLGPAPREMFMPFSVHPEARISRFLERGVTDVLGINIYSDQAPCGDTGSHC